MTSGRLRRTAQWLLLGVLLVATLELMSWYVFEHLFGRGRWLFANGKYQVERFLGRKSAEQQRSIIPHPYLLYTNNPGTTSGGYRQYNSMGYRNDEFTVAKPPGTLRILALGGSTTDMRPFVPNPKQAWTALLQQRLAAHLGQPVEVINAGLPSGTSAELLAAWMFRHRYLKPDILIFHEGWNDIPPLMYDGYNPEYTHYRAQGGGMIPRPGERFILTWSQFARVLDAIWLDDFGSVYQRYPHGFKMLNRADAVARVKENPSPGFSRNVELLVRDAVTDGIRVLLVGFLQARVERLAHNRPDLAGLEEALVVGVEKHDRIMMAIAAKHRQYFLKLNQAEFDDSWFRDSHHLDERGDKRKAELIFDALVTQRIVRKT